MTRARFKNTLQNLYFPNNTEADRKDKGYKVRPLIIDFNQSFLNVYQMMSFKASISTW